MIQNDTKMSKRKKENKAAATESNIERKVGTEAAKTAVENNIWRHTMTPRHQEGEEKSAGQRETGA